MPSGLQIIEPYWKVLLSAKAILPILWDLFPDHPNLLPTYFEWDRSKLGMQYVQKPIYSREGANVTIHDFLVIEQTEGPYDKSKSVFQAYAPLPDFEGYHPVIGSWIIGGQPAGMGIRESESLITGNFSRFVPHFIEG
jgi:glutathionylspermidine synthase